MKKISLGLLSLFLMPVWGEAAELPPPTSQQEIVTAAPLIADGLLFVGSKELTTHQGHLRAFSLHNPQAGALWDAAEKVPLPGTGAAPGELPTSDPPTTPSVDNLVRSVYTNLPGTDALMSFTPLSATELQGALGQPSPAAAAVLINRVRGRLGATVDNPAGTADDPVRLWGISRSAPVLVGRAPMAQPDGIRDRVLYVGAEDGQLHALFTGRWDRSADRYGVNEPEAGAELWSYLPGSLLASMATQPFEEPAAPVAITLDGSPVVTEEFIDLDGDGVRQWQTLLVATASVPVLQRSCLFALEISDPYRPQLLWERWLPGDNLGLSRGVRLARVAGLSGTKVFLSAATAQKETIDGRLDERTGAHGLQFAALDLLSGELLWQTTLLYDDSAGELDAAPALPSLVDRDADGRADALVCGDLAGRLWLLDAASGAIVGDAPIFETPGGSAEPIGAGVAVHGRRLVFGTGGATHADPQGQYALYALDLLPQGVFLAWHYPLEIGEQVWAMPQLDALGNLLVGTAAEVDGTTAEILRPGRGRLLVLDQGGVLQQQAGLSAAAVARPVAGSGTVVSVTLTGEVQQYGVPPQNGNPDEGTLGSVQVLSWRLR